MSPVDIAQQFAQSFQQATGDIAATTFANSIRFTAIMLVIIGLMWCINHFLGHNAREQDGFLVLFGSRLIRLVIGLCSFILILIVKGNGV